MSIRNRACPPKSHDQQTRTSTRSCDNNKHLHYISDPPRSTAITMSAPSSPEPSFESEEHPVSNGSTTQATEAAANEPSRAHSPRRRSIQFSVGGTESQFPTRSMSFKDKRRSYSESPAKEESPDKDSKNLAVNRGPSPPPPKYVLTHNDTF